MDIIEEQALWLEALSDKVLHQLAPGVWKQLFLGSGRDSIRFEQRHLTLVHVDVKVAPGQPAGATERFYQELQRINGKHNGRLDPYVHAAALITFDDPSAAIRLAMELQRLAPGVELRIGVVSGLCTVAFFRAQGRLWCTPLGSHTRRVAEMAASASQGGIVISPETYAPDEIRARRRDYAAGAPDFQDSELDLSTLSGIEDRHFDIRTDVVDIYC